MIHLTLDNIYHIIGNLVVLPGLLDFNFKNLFQLLTNAKGNLFGWIFSYVYQISARFWEKCPLIWLVGNLKNTKNFLLWYKKIVKTLKYLTISTLDRKEYMYIQLYFFYVCSLIWIINAKEFLIDVFRDTR